MIKHLTYAIVAGFIALIAALFLAEFVTLPEFGHRVDVSKWSEEAKSIMGMANAEIVRRGVTG